MGYPKDLEEYSLAELKAEIQRREANTKMGLCDYCRRPINGPACKFPDRHKPKENNNNATR